MPLVVGEKDRGMADSAAINSQRDRIGCAGMARCPLTVIWPRSPRIPQILLWMQLRLLYMPQPQLKKGSVVTARHNKLRERVVDLAGKDFTPTQVLNDPLIFEGRAVHITKENLARPTFPPTRQKSEAMEQKGDLMIRDLWKKGTESVYEMSVLNTDTKSHLTKTPEKCLQEAERLKKEMYLEACLQ